MMTGSLAECDEVAPSLISVEIISESSLKIPGSLSIIEL